MSTQYVSGIGSAEPSLLLIHSLLSRPPHPCWIPPNWLVSQETEPESGGDARSSETEKTEKHRIHKLYFNKMLQLDIRFYEFSFQSGGLGAGPDGGHPGIDILQVYVAV